MMAKSTPTMDEEGWFEKTNDPKVKQPVMIQIPAGSFLMGTSEDNIKQLQIKESAWAYDWYDNDFFAAEQPQHKLTLKAFEVAQYPVTNAEYHVFTWDTGHRLPKGWKGFTFDEETGMHPVIGVSKKDAEAYITWINEKLDTKYRLPTEAEWERAARGTDGRIYPWGNTFDPWRCNTAESAKRGTTPVDFYSPGGDSPSGVADMVGNVWEWTSSIFSPYPYRFNDGRELHKPKVRYVIRGGAWYYTRKLARCAAREGMLEEYLSNSAGFRLACTTEDPAKNEETKHSG
jgi:toxoflavin biosynthesis protein ToxD